MPIRDTLKPKKKKRSHQEYDLQCAIIELSKRDYPNILLFSVPLEACAKKFPHFQKSGALKGTSDLVLVSNRGVCFIELKSPNGRLRAEQKEFAKAVEALGYEFHVVRSIDSFIDIANRFI